MEHSFSIDTGLAPYSCISCRTKKRKCDRVRPSCGLCSKSYWSCKYKKRNSAFEGLHYDTPNGSQSGSDINIPSPEIEEVRTADFPPVYFLNPNLFHSAGMKLPNLDIPIPGYVQELIGDAKDQRSIASSYFNGVNYFFPIISRTRLYKHALNILVKPRADGVLLLLSMKLATLHHSGNMSSTPEYLAAKQFHSSIETSAICSLQFLQASILLCLYEFGHAIYPAAYYSIANAARYSTAFGMDNIESDSGVSGDRLEAEEKRRAWWTILILDSCRCVNLGNPTRQLSTQGPLPSSLLPIDDVSWDNEVAPSSSPYAFGPSTLSMGKFARFAQAICLLGRAYCHVADRTTDSAFLEEEAERLCKTLRALVDLVEIESQLNEISKRIEYCTQTAVCYSALLILRDSYPTQSFISSLELNYSLHTTITSVTAAGVNIARRFTAQSPAAPVHQISPFILHFLYQCAVFYIEQPENEVTDPMAVDSLKELFRSLQRKWGAAAAYLEIIEAHEMMQSM